ncbi:MAG: DHHA1 domain-containing protein [Patescibacteria group bacterium]
MKNIVILYHAQCSDGFGAAYAAWRKFGDTADYLPVEHQKPPPEGLEGKEVYIADFSYPKETLAGLQKIAKRVVILDHHLGAKSDVESVQEFVFDEKRSGAGIAWDYFHPEKKRPQLLNYVQDGDLYTFTLPDARSILAYVYLEPYTFESWNNLEQLLENENTRNEIKNKGASYKSHWNLLVEKIMQSAELVEFEGYQCYLVSTHDMFKSDVGNKLAQKKGPLALVTRAKGDFISVSLRGDGTVDLSDIAKKYGGNGHPNAAAFRIPYGTPTPWKLLNKGKDVL